MGKKLYIGNLGFEVTNKDLEELFAKAGVTGSASVVTDRATGQSRGFGFMEVESSADVQKAIQQLDGHEFQGRALKVDQAHERERSGGGRGGNDGGRSRRY